MNNNDVCIHYLCHNNNNYNNSISDVDGVDKITDEKKIK